MVSIKLKGFFTYNPVITSKINKRIVDTVMHITCLEK